jgi:hypothetical protein
MRISTLRTTAGAVLVTLLITSSAFARNHDILNGAWALVPTRSDFAGQPVVETGTVTINDHEGVTVVSRSFVYEGATATFFYKDSTGSQFGGTVQTGKDLKTKTRWDHDILKVTTTRSGAVTLESYSLAADGSMTVSVEGPDHKTVALVFERK